MGKTAKTFADVLKERRESADLTVVALAGMVDVSRQTIHAWERGVASPDVKHLLRLAVALNCKACDLIDSLPLPNGPPRRRGK